MRGLDDVSDYDKTAIREIVAGQGTWLTTYTLRYLNIALGKADMAHRKVLLETFPDEARLIYTYWGWSEYEINAVFEETLNEHQ